MLNSDTKRHIDAARDVLVGVAPNPTTQIDQITYALIYKFMDDMDQASVKAGGEASFFVGDLEKYAWSNLMSTRLGNQEKTDLYSEALTKFSEAKQLPELFRTIFRAAFLPYRSPETLGLFLKEISYFDYTHPEELGNAYEYLLSIMSSQGDAGQFRTPRHIIDFIVDVINPTKDDKVLDPACGTGGFLVSTYNHILEQHDGQNDSDKKEKPLTPDERKKLMSNLQGYDIDPTMVRIAQVNMYLHQFKNPQIFQYDSLTSEERWNDKYDVILANPPFMSPRGGIKPHNKFNVSSNRAEVLFVDYIINHLKPKGRAGIVVPEGVIFQSGKAYKELRKNLIENGLFAVVSLPGGVFQPYSGVKTSILLFDNEQAKKKSEIAFVKISADGFDLGSSKRAISQNDLPEALNFLQMWARGENLESPLVSFVEKSELLNSADYSLSGDRYKEGVDYSNSKWDQVALREILEVQNGFAFDSKLFNDNRDGLPLIRIRDVNSGLSNTFYSGEYDEKYLVSDGDLLVGMDGDFKTTIWRYGTALLNQRVCRLKNFKGANKKYVYYVIQSELNRIQDETYAVTVKHISSAQIQDIAIPLPPLEMQEKIANELDTYAAIISGAKLIVDNWKPGIEVDLKWPNYKLSELCELITKGTTPTSIGFNFTDSGINFVKIESITGNGNFIASKFAYISEECHNALSRSKLKEGDVLFSIAGALGRTAVVTPDILPANTNQALAILRLKPEAKVLPQFLEYLLLTDTANAQSKQSTTGVAQQNISLGQLGEYSLPVPTLEVQEALVAEVKKQEALVRGSSLLASQYIEKTQKVIAQLWNTTHEIL